MTRNFQSVYRNCDMGGKAQFKLYRFSTDDPELAEFVAKNCAKHPTTYWEITPEMLKSPDPEVKRKIGRPRKDAVIVGMRGSGATEGEAV